MTKRTTLLFLLLIIFIAGGSAQSDFRKGYVIALEGDTLYGEIDYRGDKRMSSICSFRVDQDSDVKEYTPDEIRAYRFVDSKYFVSKELKGKRFFFEYLIKGQLNIYYLRDEKSRYYIEKEGVGFVELPFEEGIRKAEDGKDYAYETVKHKGILEYFMSDAPELKNDIYSVREPSHGALIKIGEKYHNMVCDDEKCIVYEKKQPIWIKAEAIGGVQFYNKRSFDEDDYKLDKEASFTGGVLLHLNMPSENENLYLRTGVLYGIIDYLELNYRTGMFEKRRENVFQVPLQIEYIYGKDTLIKPKIAGGVKILLPEFFWGYALMAGVNVRLSKSVYWSINYDIDFDNGSSFLPKRVFSHSFTTGVFYSF